MYNNRHLHLTVIFTCLILGLLSLSACRISNTGTQALPDSNSPVLVDPADRTGVALGTSSASPVISALASQLGQAEIDMSDASSMADSIAEAAMLAVSVDDLLAGDTSEMESLLAAALATGIPVLFENSAALDEYEAILEQLANVDTLDPDALLEVISSHATPAEMDAAMEAMALAVGLGVDSQFALYVPVLNDGSGFIDGKPVHSVIYTLGAELPLEIINVTSAYEIDGVAVPDEEVVDIDDMETPTLPESLDWTDLVDPEKLNLSTLDDIELDPQALVAELQSLLEEAVAEWQVQSSETSTVARTTSGYTTAPPSEVIRHEFDIIGKKRNWYPCDKDQKCSLQIKARVQLYRSLNPNSGIGNKYVRVCGNQSNWHMSDAQEFDEVTDQGYYMYQSKNELGLCNSEGDWLSYPSWLELYDTGNYGDFSNQTKRISTEAPIYYRDSAGVKQVWNAKWEENVNRDDWKMTKREKTGRVTWENTMVKNWGRVTVRSWEDMFVDGDCYAASNNYAHGQRPPMYAQSMAIWKLPETIAGTERFRIYHKMWVRNTWVIPHLFWSDEEKHREDHCRKQFRFTVDFADV